METIVHFSDCKSAPKKFSLNITQQVVLIATIVLLIVIALLKNIFTRDKGPFSKVDLSSWEYLI
jgi:hypothetical protein